TLRLAAALRAERFEPAAGYQIGAELVAADFAAPEALARTVTLLHTQLLSALGLVPDRASTRLAQLVEALSVGPSRAGRDMAMDEQEAVRRAAVEARHHAEHQQRAPPRPAPGSTRRHPLRLHGPPTPRAVLAADRARRHRDLQDVPRPRRGPLHHGGSRSL